MALICRGESVFPTEILLRRERGRRRGCITLDRNAVRTGSLQPTAGSSCEGSLQPVVILSAFGLRWRHHTPLGIGPLADVREGIVDPGDGVVAHIDVPAAERLVPKPGEDVICLDGHRFPELSLDADRGLIAV